jgi:hypothetical protein
MRQINCYLPIRLDITGEPSDEQLDLLSKTLAARISFASRALSSAHPETDASIRPHSPTFTFQGGPIREDSRTRIERAVRHGIQRALGWTTLPEANPRIVLARAEQGATSAQSLNASGNEQRFWSLLRKQLRIGLDAAERAQFSSQQIEAMRAGAIAALMDLLERAPARSILREVMSIPASQSGVRAQILEALALGAGRKGDAAWDLILSAVGQKGDMLAEEKFVRWFRREQGHPAADYLKRKLSEIDPELQQKAVRVAGYLLELKHKPEAQKFESGLKYLQEVIAGEEQWARTAVEAQTSRQLINSQISIMLELLPDLIHEVRRSAPRDPFDNQDEATLVNFGETLRKKQDQLNELDLSALQALDAQVSLAMQAAFQVQQRIVLLHNSVRQIQQFLGSTTAESDEIMAYFQLRHRYISIFGMVLNVNEENFLARLFDIERDFVQFDRVVLRVKWARFRTRLSEVKKTLGLAKQLLYGGIYLDETFLSIQRFVEQEEPDLGAELFIIPDVPGSNAPTQGIVKSYAEAEKIENRLRLLALNGAIYALYALALNLRHTLFSNDIGTELFRREQDLLLLEVRLHLQKYAQQSDFVGFAEKADFLQQRLADVAHNVEMRARVDVLVNLLITAVAALIAAEVVAAARLALIGEVVAGVRSAQAASAIVFMLNVGVFTTAQLAGESLVHGKRYTLGQVGQALVSNALFFGVFHVLGETVASLVNAKTLMGMLAQHSINVTIMTGASFVLTELETGQWPPDVKMFLVNNIANYVIVAGVGGVVETIEAPKIRAQAAQMRRVLNSELADLYKSYQRAVETRTLTEQDFEMMRGKHLDLNNRALEMQRFLASQGVVDKNQTAAVEEYIAKRNAEISAARFEVSPTMRTASDVSRVIRALPLPTAIQGVTQLGSSNIYRYQAGETPSELNGLMLSYQRAGYQVQQYEGGAVRVFDAANNTLFVLEPGPVVRGLLPPPKPGFEPRDFADRAPSGQLTQTQYEFVREALREVNKRVVAALEAAFKPEALHQALRLLYRYRSAGVEDWSVYAARGLGEMLEPGRGIDRPDVERLFKGALTRAELQELFEMYHEISHYPGAELLVDHKLTPSQSLQLIRAYDALRRARFDLPEDMTPDAVRGLLRWWTDDPATFLSKIKDIPLDQRAERLEVASGVIRLPLGADSPVLIRYGKEIRSGIDLLTGSPADVTQKIEAWARHFNGRFTDQTVRERFERLVDQYQKRYASLQAGRHVERNIAGLREEIHVTLLQLEAGAEIFALGAAQNDLVIDPALFPLPRGYRLINASEVIEVQIDVGARTVDGRLLIMEVTTGTLELPENFRGLDRESGLPENGVIDERLIDKSDASQRKMLQMIKLRNLAQFATELGRAWGDADVRLPDMVIRASKVNPDARRVAEALGFRVEGPEPKR